MIRRGYELNFMFDGNHHFQVNIFNVQGQYLDMPDAQSRTHTGNVMYLGHRRNPTSSCETWSDFSDGDQVDKTDHFDSKNTKKGTVALPHSSYSIHYLLQFTILLISNI